MTDEPQLWEIARSLYATTLPDFVRVRNTRVRELKKSGDTQTAQRVAAFKKPSVAADLVNRLARDDGGLADEIADLGARLRAAQVDADSATLRGLDQERRGLVGRCVAWARAEAERGGGAATEAMLRDVEQTVWAAIVDAWAAATVRAGVLVRPLSPGGFGQVDVSGASALDVDEPAEPDRPVRRRPAKKREPRPETTTGPEPARPSAAEARARRAAEEALEQAQASAGAAQDRLEEAAAKTEAADTRRTGLEDERDRLRAELSEVDRQLREAHQEISEGRAALRQAEKQRRTAAAEVDRALRTLEKIQSP